MKTALVLGAGGFIGSHLVKRLKAEGYWVRGVDLKYPEFSKSEANEFLIYDLRDPVNTQAVLRLDTELRFTFHQRPFTQEYYFDEVYQLAADMGGAGYIFTGEHDADVMHNSASINLNVCDVLKGTKTKVFYSSSACMYPQEIQWMSGKSTTALKESDAYPGNPDSEYGWEKLFSERLYIAYARNYGLDIRIARFHNIYGPEGTYKGGKEKAPAAMCRKAIEAASKSMQPGRLTMDVWGDGLQTRSFLYIDDCINAVRLLMESDFKEPINIGSEEMVSINDLANLAIRFTDLSIHINHIDGPTGVRGRNSNNDLIREKLNWNPKYTLRSGMERTFDWIKSQMNGL